MRVPIPEGGAVEARIAANAALQRLTEAENNLSYWAYKGNSGKMFNAHFAVSKAKAEYEAALKLLKYTAGTSIWFK